MFSRSILFVAAFSVGICHAADNKTIYGVNETILIEDIGLELKAKLDTGAETASLSARDIELFDRNDKSWVRFKLAIDNAPDEIIERPVKRISRIKRRSADILPDEKETTHTPRPVIELHVCMGNSLQKIEVNLTDRSHFKFPFLLGTKALTSFNALVDPAAQFVAGKPGCPAQKH